ncbi:hypothetical protein EXIGLDRAFT_743871, partial [Exidia glandulosa HHB12029]
CAPPSSSLLSPFCSLPPPTHSLLGAERPVILTKDSTSPAPASASISVAATRSRRAPGTIASKSTPTQTVPAVIRSTSRARADSAHKSTRETSRSIPCAATREAAAISERRHEHRLTVDVEHVCIVK